MEAILRLRGRIGRIGRRAEVLLWVDGKEAFPRIEKLLKRAQHTIVIQMFIWKDDNTGRRIASVLVEAADRGVRVDITKEATGDVFELHQDFLSTSKSLEGIWKTFWSHPNIHIHHINENNHAKVFVIDNHTLMLGGMNIADECEGSWHDYMVELRGSRFIDQYLTGGEIVETATKDVHLLLNSSTNKQIRSCVTELISHAANSIILEQSYISDPEVVQLLAKRSQEGVRVTLVIPESPDVHYHANMQAVQQLLAQGSIKHIRVFLYPGFVHGKLILIDFSSLFIGSANLMASSLDEMGEANVLIEGGRRRALLKAREIVRRDILRSKPLITPPRMRWLEKRMAAVGL